MAASRSGGSGYRCPVETLIAAIAIVAGVVGVLLGAYLQRRVSIQLALADARRETYCALIEAHEARVRALLRKWAAQSPQDDGWNDGDDDLTAADARRLNADAIRDFANARIRALTVASDAAAALIDDLHSAWMSVPDDGQVSSEQWRRARDRMQAAATALSTQARREMALRS